MFQIISEEGATTLEENVSSLNEKYTGLSNTQKIREIIAENNLDIMEWHFPKAISGLIVHDENSVVIGLNANHSRYEQLYTLAHELGHFFLGHGDRFCTSGEEAKSVEVDANAFARKLLMPDEEVRQLLKEKGQCSVVSNYYYLSYEVVEERIKEI